MGWKVFILTYLCAICATHAFHPVFPEGKEVVYEYIGTISTSAITSIMYTSSYTLIGNLHLQSQNNSVFAKLSDLKYEIYNGIEHEYDSKALPISEEMGDFEKTFRIEYYPSGNIAGIATGKDEKQYVVNFKKAISSMLQLDLQMMKKHESQKAYAFHTDENTVYGKGKVYYNVKSDKDHYHIDVMHEPRSTRHLYTHMLTNVDYISDTSDYDEPISRDSQRRCVLNKVGDDRIIDFMEHNGGIYYTPFSGEGQAHTLNINQSLVLTTTKPISSNLEVESEVYHNDLTYHVANLDNVDSTYPDFTNGRRHLPVDVMVDKAINLVKEIVDFMAEYHIEDAKMDFEKSQRLGQLSHMMLFFDEKMLNEMYDKLSNEVYNTKRQYLKFYLQLLPLTGTHATSHFILKLIKNKTIYDDRAFDTMFDNVMYPNKKLVNDMAEVLKWDSKEYSPVIYKTVILSFGTLLHKAMDRNHQYTLGNSKKYYKYGYHPNNKLEDEFPDHKYYEKYVIELVSKLKATKQYDHQILFLQALQNTKMESIVQHLLPAVRGDWWEDSQLRMLAAFTISEIVVKNEELTFEIFWPLMTNPDEPTTFRIMSYYIIMKSQPSLQRLLNIYWTMSSIQNHELYMFHYKYISALSESETPHNRKFIVHLMQILKYTSRPDFRGLTGYHHLDYFNELYSVGEEVEFMTVHSKHEDDIVLAGSYQYSVNRLTTEPYWFYLRVSGFHPSFLKELKLDTTSKKTLFTWDKLVNYMLTLGQHHDAKFTLILAANGHVFSTHYYDKNNLVDFMAFAKQFDFDLKGRDQQIDLKYELSKTIIMPTDFGFPAVFFNYVPDIDYSDIVMDKTTKDAETKFIFDVKFKSLTPAKRGLAFYNPFLDVFQGVSKLHTTDYEVNFRINATIDTAQQMLKVSWKKKTDKTHEVALAERHYVTTAVYVLDDFKNGALQKSSPKSKNIEIVELGDEYKTNKTSQILPLFDLGSDFIEYVFEQEEPLPKELDSEVDYDKDGLKETLKAIMYSIRFEELQPEDISYGLTRTLKTSDDYPIDQIDMTLKYDAEYKKGNNYLHPAATYKMKLHYVAGKESAPFTSWIADATFDMDDGHVNNIFKGQVTKGITDVDIKVCFEGDAIWSSNDVKSSFYLSTNLLEDRTCSKKDYIFNVELIGERSQEQIENKYSYKSCFKDVKGQILGQKSHECLFEYDSFRKYTLKLKHGFNEEKKKKYEDKITQSATKIFEDSDSIEPIAGIESNEMRFIFEIPVKPTAPLTLQVYTEDDGTKHTISESVDTEELSSFSGSVFEFLHDFGLTDVCVVNNHKMKHTNKVKGEVEYTVPKDWSLFLGTKTEPKFELFLKSADGEHVMLKVVFKTHSLIVEPKDDEYIFTVDGKEMSESFYNCDWMHYAQVKDTEIVSVFIENIGIHVVYNGNQASIEYPQIEGVEMHGHCMDENTHA